MNRIIAPLVIAAVVVLVLISLVFYQINETEQVIITQFGKPVSEPITQRLAYDFTHFIHVRASTVDLLVAPGSPGNFSKEPEEVTVLLTGPCWLSGTFSNFSFPQYPM